MCSWLHIKLDSLPYIKFPFNKAMLPERGIYFFYEEGQNSDHGNGLRPRIVRIGTHKNNNFRSRISEHFLTNESKLNFNQHQPKPSNRSIFRKNIGRAILNRNKSNYLNIWEIDFTIKANKMARGSDREIKLERKLEMQITKLLREKFTFKYISLEVDSERIGSGAMEWKLISAVSSCDICMPTSDWLGKYSPKREISSGKLWLSQGLQSPSLVESDKDILNTAFNRFK